MRIGLMLPGVITPPRSTADWERRITPDQMVTAAGIADDAGYSHLGCSEHIAVPRITAEERGGTYWDPLATLAYVAASTVRIRLLTQVLVLGYHHPLAVAKRYGTLDRLSAGRVVLGVGVGSLEQEFTLLGAEFAGRGARGDDALRALRAAWGRRYPSYHGSHYAFDDVEVAPAAVREMIAIWVGGSTRRSLRRAIELGDGWMPYGHTMTEYAELLAGVDLPDDFEVVLPVLRFLDPVSDPSAAAEALKAARAAGATVANVAFRAATFEEWCNQAQALAAAADAWGLDFSDPRAELTG